MAHVETDRAARRGHARLPARRRRAAAGPGAVTLPAGAHGARRRHRADRDVSIGLAARRAARVSRRRRSSDPSTTALRAGPRPRARARWRAEATAAAGPGRRGRAAGRRGRGVVARAGRLAGRRGHRRRRVKARPCWTQVCGARRRPRSLRRRSHPMAGRERSGRGRGPRPTCSRAAPWVRRPPGRAAPRRPSRRCATLAVAVGAAPIA